MFRLLGVLLCMVGCLWTATAKGASPEDAVQKYARTRLEVARRGLVQAERATGSAASEDYADIWIWSRRVLEAELALSTTKRERIAALEGHLQRAAKLEKLAQRKYSRGGFTRLDVLEAIYRRCDVEVQLAQEKAQTEPSRP